MLISQEVETVQKTVYLFLLAHTHLMDGSRREGSSDKKNRSSRTKKGLGQSGKYEATRSLHSFFPRLILLSLLRNHVSY